MYPRRVSHLLEYLHYIKNCHKLFRGTNAVRMKWSENPLQDRDNSMSWDRLRRKIATEHNNKYKQYYYKRRIIYNIL